MEKQANAPAKIAWKRHLGKLALKRKRADKIARDTRRDQRR